MHFQHSPDIWKDFPELAAGVLLAGPIDHDAVVEPQLAAYEAVATSRLATGSEGQLPEIQAWRRAYSRMGLKPTQYRCASESLLRRFRREHSLPRVHPLVDLCNAMSMASGVPVAVFDVARLDAYLEVRYATGEETYDTFSGGTEHPEPQEVVFADGAGRAHARRWTNRQSGYSAVRDSTRTVLVVAETMHSSAAGDVTELIERIAHELGAAWPVTPRSAILSRSSPRFELW
jgi:DNA/RNA-binding domain of Phe-tRNA-synthetase-like protein